MSMFYSVILFWDAKYNAIIYSNITVTWRLNRSLSLSECYMFTEFGQSSNSLKFTLDVITQSDSSLHYLAKYLSHPSSHSQSTYYTIFWSWGPCADNEINYLIVQMSLPVGVAWPLTKRGRLLIICYAPKNMRKYVIYWVVQKEMAQLLISHKYNQDCIDMWNLIPANFNMFSASVWIFDWICLNCFEVKPLTECINVSPFNVWPLIAWLLLQELTIYPILF